MNAVNIFTVTKKDTHTKARAGELTTAHGTVLTPVFMPVGSQASVKSVTPDELRDIGIRMILSNTYHLYLRPGVDIIEKLGGLHKFMNWDRAILTDSGGYQIFSLSQLRKVSDEGVTFRSHIDGSEHFITPELAVEFQEKLGSDVMMVLDECPPHDANLEQIKEATQRTHAWAERCRKAQQRRDQLLFGIVQGGLSPELRRESAQILTSLDFPGYAVGGLSIGEPKNITFVMLEEALSMLPENKPRYFMGVGAPEDLMEGVSRGVDMFDCVLPTRVARNGAFFTRHGRRSIRNSMYRQKDEPLINGCKCYTCRTFSAAYLHHLFSREELLAYRLMTIHNLYFIHELMGQIRESIIEGNFSSFKSKFLSEYSTTNEKTRLTQKQKWIQTHRVGKPPEEVSPVEE